MELAGIFVNGHWIKRDDHLCGVFSHPSLPRCARKVHLLKLMGQRRLQKAPHFTAFVFCLKFVKSWKWKSPAEVNFVRWGISISATWCVMRGPICLQLCHVLVLSVLGDDAAKWPWHFSVDVARRKLLRCLSKSQRVKNQYTNSNLICMLSRNSRGSSSQAKKSWVLCDLHNKNHDKLITKLTCTC